MKPEPVPAGTSSTARRKGSITARLLVTNTVEGATASNTLIELRSSSVLALGPRAAIGGGAGTGAGVGTVGAAGEPSNACSGAGSGRLELGRGSASGPFSAWRSWQVPSAHTARANTTLENQRRIMGVQRRNMAFSFREIPRSVNVEGRFQPRRNPDGVEAEHEPVPGPCGPRALDCGANF